jgi:hypothetical protein
VVAKLKNGTDLVLDQDREVEKFLEAVLVLEKCLKKFGL